MASRRRIVIMCVAGGFILSLGIAGFFAKSALSNSGSVSSGPLAQQEEIVAPSMEPAPCDFAEWNGLSRDEVESRVKATGRSNRILPPGSAMTMDYRPDRINVELDDNDIVVRVFCG